MGKEVEAVATDVFGYRGLREGQATAITALTEGRDCLVVMPSGAASRRCTSLPR